MSKVPAHRRSKIPASKPVTAQLEERPVSSQPAHSTPNKVEDNEVQNNQIQVDSGSKESSNVDKKYFNCGRGFGLKIPKFNISVENIGEKLVQNPRILDLRNKLNEINKKRDRDVNKEAKTLINDTRQLAEEDEQGDGNSGPYSLMLYLNDTQVSSDVAKSEALDVWKYDAKIHASKGTDYSSAIKQEQPSTSRSTVPIGDRRPNVINFEGKGLTEFEYYCEADDTQKQVNAQNLPRNSRSDLCLHFTTAAAKPNKIDLPSPVTDNSLHPPNDEHSLDDSLGILTPDQMDDMFSPTVENLPVFGDELKISPDSGETPSTDKTNSNSPVSTMFMDQDAPPDRQTSESMKITPLTKTSTLIETDHIADDSRVPDVSPSGYRNFESITTDVDATLDESAMQFGECDGKVFFTEKHNDIFKDTNLVPNIEDELLPSVHSSILEPVSSLVDTTINLDLPLDSKHFENIKSHASQRIEQTPSPEDLPLDPSELHGESATFSNSQDSAPTLHDSQTFSEPKTDFVKSMETSKVSSSFITSITSITSLDGYQGDGEMSRPVSRGAEPVVSKEDAAEINWQNVPVNRRPDPMTDSDFFTESDADGHDDHMHRGDRRAQVIDGALYGGKNNAPLIVNRNDDSCMESSGVYTDLETHRCSPVLLNAVDLSPTGSSPSTRSECSQKTNGDRKESLENGSIKLKVSSSDVSSTSDKISLKKVDTKPEKQKEKFSLKKYKMPKRDVPSKLKTMLSRKPEPMNQETSPSKTSKNGRELTPKKSIDNKTKSFKDIKSKVDCCFSLQRSQTACSVTRMLTAKSTAAAKPKTRHMRTRLAELGVGVSGKSSMHSSHSDLSASSVPPAKLSARFPFTRNPKKRDNVSSACGGGGGVTSPRAPAPTPAPAPPAQGKKIVGGGGVSALPKLPASPVTSRARPAPASPRKPAQRRAPAAPAAARPTALSAAVKEPARGAGSLRSTGKRPPAHAPPSPAAPPAPAQPPDPPRPAAQEPGSAALSHAAKGVEALGVLVQYLVCQLEAVNGEGWRAEAARWRGLAAAERTGAARASREHHVRAQKDLDTIGECLSKISELEMEVACKEEQNARMLSASRDAEAQYRATLDEVALLAADIKGLKGTIASLKRDVCESRSRLRAGAERERALAAQLEAARRDVARAQLERHPDLDKSKAELAAEVCSLRAVLELKQAESSELRQARGSLAAECERRAGAEREAESLRRACEELRERAGARQRDADALRDENRRLREGAARDRHAHARLTLYNEELRYKLGQKSQVLSLLASGGGGAYLDRSYSSPPSPPPYSPSPHDSPSPPGEHSPGGARRTPAVKGVVEKQDSVSWVLEIEESAEEVASRIARRSGSFRSPGGGVKRRGGGSPGAPGSPAPASPAPNASKLFRCSGERASDLSAPPLKESAGEAIYIYDNRQY